ncbi:MAG: methionine biosynthesis protein MetW [Desulfobacteraceae bacterium]|nr:MAG: methionine biosynthesis protein MetW [Desulfobacteraceae bacterium]
MLKSENNNLRFDLMVIASWIRPNSRVLDLGCGEGELLMFLQTQKQATGSGIDQKESNVFKCIEKGLSVIQGDINSEVEDYPDFAFDYVILSQTLQQVYAPSELLRSLLRIGKNVIVSFPNFSHWRVRVQLLLTGQAPVTSQLPYEWYNTPNIRVMTLKDFRNYAKKIGFGIIRQAAIATGREADQGKIVRFCPDLMASYGIFLIGNRK